MSTPGIKKAFKATFKKISIKLKMSLIIRI